MPSFSTLSRHGWITHCSNATGPLSPSSGIAAKLRSVRLTHSRELLRTTDLTIAEVAEACGIEPAYFSRLFRKEYGMAPSEYR